ncbi:tRNA (5-methylaminomethyl-2-thiouridylate)-methyltransferase [Candidatus Syntrophocurvum alkaliphilum]|uniref:tRNA (5-methylaminomethyl-2-thiouridylate)-methyltransferase n=1 Tax=Candidatus Syntrophocurvum alkaliphilum TaxID=2293317 RepID=A0A6I6DDN5_9FIRM|nr:DUF814 domain-containing protein [Candidatus Syntrophocurvum alkaliphilum]QGT99317.1 tRNA (5-methylaminomethyl-2-thiouridylate)-methyltransferase [Candidatus Syntrophocurvum alkaliphilum]
MKAISLFSGGLDSQLAAKIIKDLEIEIIAINFKSPFFGATEETIQAAKDLGIKLLTPDISEEYMDVVKKPIYGYGKNFNPCIDCHAFMFKKAGDLMLDLEASFLITGEVLGQRPMSQNKSALQTVEKLSGYKGYILRPLSAKLLPITIPEENGWVDREQLLDISGRSRTRQMALAEEYGIVDYPSPAGGCLLTDENFSRRLKKTLEITPDHGAKGLEILKIGRHFYIGDYNLLVIGRNHSENESLKNIAFSTDYLLKVADRPGPLAILRKMNTMTDEDIYYAGQIVARYSDAKNETTANIRIFNTENAEGNIINVQPLKPEETPALV